VSQVDDGVGSLTRRDRTMQFFFRQESYEGLQAVFLDAHARRGVSAYEGA
jgi:hypothetical protein